MIINALFFSDINNINLLFIKLWNQGNVCVPIKSTFQSTVYKELTGVTRYQRETFQSSFRKNNPVQGNSYVNTICAHYLQNLLLNYQLTSLLWVRLALLMYNYCSVYISPLDQHVSNHLSPYTHVSILLEEKKNRYYFIIQFVYLLQVKMKFRLKCFYFGLILNFLCPLNLIIHDP